MNGSSTFGHHGKRGPLSYRQMALRRRIFTAKRPAEQVNLIGQDANVISDVGPTVGKPQKIRLVH